MSELSMSEPLMSESVMYSWQENEALLGYGRLRPPYRKPATHVKAKLKIDKYLMK
jgi:hypothetical protein